MTDLQKKRIIADYIELGSYRAVAKMHGISETAVRNIVKKDADTLEKCAQKKMENTVNILAYMDSRRDKVKKIIDEYLDRLLDPERIAKASPNQLTTAMGTLIDKFTMQGVTKNEHGITDDPLSAALKELAAELDAGRTKETDRYSS